MVNGNGAVPAIQPPRVWTQEELGQILNACEYQWERCLVIGLAQTGARRQEWASIRRETFHGNWAVVRNNHSKSQQGHRVLYIPPETEVEIITCMKGRDQMYIDRIPREGRGRKFNEASPMTPEGLKKALQLLLKRAGAWQPLAGFHTFRHSYTREFLVSGGTPEYLPILLGYMKGGVAHQLLRFPDVEVMKEAMDYAPRRFLQFDRNLPARHGT